MAVTTTTTPKHESDHDVQDSIQLDCNSISSLPDPSYYHHNQRTFHEIHRATLPDQDSPVLLLPLSHPPMEYLARHTSGLTNAGGV